MIGQQRQQRVRGGAGDDLQMPGLLELPEGAHQVAPAGCVSVTHAAKPPVIEQGEFMEWLFPVRPLDFLFRKFDQLVEVPLVTCLQERIAQHRAERRRQRECQAGIQPVPPPALQQLQQRHVGFCDGLEKPVLLQEPLVLRVADKRQVRVEDQSKVAGHVGNNARVQRLKSKV